MAFKRLLISKRNWFKL